MFGACAALSVSCDSEQKLLAENKGLVKKEVEGLYNAKDISVADQIYSTDLVTHTPNVPRPGNLAQLKKDVAEVYEAFPDLHLTIDDLFAGGDRVTKRWTLQATHTKEWQGIPATGKKIVVTGINIFRMKDGKIVEFWEYMDLLGLLQQLGVVPPLG
jgi:steroid delta-isomerase-like uncharacterized protein